MTSLTTEPPTLRFIAPPSSSVTPHRRSYSCYNCNHSFHITRTAATDFAASPSSFRCPRCHHRHLIPHHTISPPPQPPPPPTPPPPLRNPDYASDLNVFVYQTSDESESDGDDYDSDNSLLSFTMPNLHPCTPALKSFVGSLRIKTFPPNSTPSLQSCSICMEDFEIKSDTALTVNELPCEHYFHKDCIVKWLQRSNTCPLCRYKLPVDPKSEGDVETGTSRWEVEYGPVLVVDLSSIREPVRRRVNGGDEPSSGSNRRGMGANVAETSGGDLDAMRDEDGDVLMIDA
ncbi:hypothetical protein CASFOL_035364 [Castilleja foliolosa]|uniref:RING-type E3 ubiquitin transferase n=1 Tax=Castilleja foliolosa TaxID=1961234 RepID=A0ABD3BT59_9LAMI